MSWKTVVEITGAEQKKRRMKRNEDSLRDLLGINKCSNVHIIGVPEGEKRGAENIFEDTIAKKFPNMEKEIATQVQEAQRVPYRINPR